MSTVLKSHHNRQIIHVHIGQFGVQSGSTIWELHCKEHGIGLDGTILGGCSLENLSRFSTFSESANGKAKPKCLFIDMESGPINRIENSRMKNLFDREFMQVGNDDAHSNFARARYGVGTELMVPAFNKLRQLLEECDCAKTCLTFRSTAGGCGGGLAPTTLEYVQDNSLKNILFSLAPSNALTTYITASYNHIFAQAESHRACDLVIPLQNEFLANSFQDHVYGRNVPSNCPPVTYENINEEIAILLSHLLAERFRSSMRMDLSSMVQNLVPFRDLKYMTSSTSRTGNHASYVVRNKANVKMMMLSCLKNSFVSRAAESTHVACAFAFRGVSTVTDITHNMSRLHIDTDFCRIHDNRFVSYVPRGTNIKLSNVISPVLLPDTFSIPPEEASCVKITNESGMDQYLLEGLDRFALLFHTYSYVHCYRYEGMELENFNASFDYVKAIANSYSHICDAGKDSDAEDNVPSFHSIPASNITPSVHSTAAAASDVPSFHSIPTSNAPSVHSTATAAASNVSSTASKANNMLTILKN